MTMDRVKKREMEEVERAMYTNCLLLGLDPSIIQTLDGTFQLGLFDHANRKTGEDLLYFILSTLRGPKEFDKVWPVFGSATRSRDFGKVVVSMISELESQGAIPRSYSVVSSLATCCGPRFPCVSRFVELLWQLSLHALREVHRRSYAADVVSNPLPASLTSVAFSHAATLVPVTKARIAVERRRFMKNAETAVERQAMWSKLAHEMTAEYRGLRAEEAYLQQELDKLHELRNKVKMEGEAWDEVVSSSSQNSHLVQRATRLWDSLLSCKSQHEVLASGPIEDLIAHREHRYRISGSSLLAAMDESSEVSSLDLEDKKEQVKVNRENVKESTVDIAEVLRRWTHALQRIHKHSLYLAKANDGEGPDILRSTSGHAESLATTLAQHRQHLASLQVLVNQLKDVAPTIQNSISELSQELNFPQMTNRSTSPVQRKMESSSDDIVEIDYKVSSALKLPPLFSLTSARSGNFYKRHTNMSPPLEQTVSNSQVNTQAQTDDYVCDMKKSVREATRSSNNNMGGQLQQDSDDHFFKKKQTSTANKQLFESQVNSYNESLYTCSNLDATNSTAASSSYAESEGRLSFYETHHHVFSPPFLIEASDSFEDLLAPLSESEKALMEQ